MKIYENEHFYIYDYDEQYYVVCPKDKYPNFYLKKEDLQNLIKKSETK